MSGDGAGRRQPDAVVVFCDHLQRAAHVPQPKRLSDDEGLQRNSVHQRSFALFQDLFEIVDDGVGKSLRRAMMDADHRNVMDPLMVNLRSFSTAGDRRHRWRGIVRRIRGRVGSQKAGGNRDLMCAISSGLIAFIPNGSWFLFAILRFFVGAGLSAAVTPSTTIVVELSPTRHRTMATSFYLVFFSAGGLIAPIVSAAAMGSFGWRGVASLGFVALIIGILVWIYTPESVRWLAAKGRFVEAPDEKTDTQSNRGANALEVTAVSVSGSRAAHHRSACRRSCRQFR
jgi:Major Facilitator Superfamily